VGYQSVKMCESVFFKPNLNADRSLVLPCDILLRYCVY
jgi:hypothetical protein